jgi:predicted nucleic acid-binding protein
LKVYADTSFLVSLYSLDAHSVKAAQLVHRFDPAFFLTPLVELELTNALELRIFRKEATAAQIRQARAELQRHVANGFFNLSAVPATVYRRARQIALKQSSATGSRTLDILHVASATLLRAEKFWTFDDRQVMLAQAEGLRLR